MNKILLASGNKGKLIEFKSLFADFPGGEIELVTPGDLGIDLDVEENGKNYAENARLKVEAYCHVSGIITLADDSGLEVEALGGRPGIYSARYSSKPGADDADRRAYLLEELLKYNQPWSACFRCIVAIMVPGGNTNHFEGICPGEIINSQRGQNGFGYDPIFVPHAEIAQRRTMAELSMAEKNQISHRALAVRAAFPFLEEVFREK